MKSILWFVVGVIAGFGIAHQVNRTDQGKQFLDELDRKAHDFGAAISEGYRKREAELRSALDDAKDTIADLS